jgi:hypothetical protein
MKNIHIIWVPNYKSVSQFWIIATIESYGKLRNHKKTLTGFINPCLTKSSASSPALSSTNKEKLFCYYIKSVHHIRTTVV